jgi:predicted glycoside hydrolase/deacetylase ChbG (UPF0249 family)
MTGRLLVVNADDFGASDGINRGIRRAHEEGVVTSASLMVHRAAAADAAAYARDRPQLAVGLHVDLAEWRLDGARWEAVYERIDTHDAAEVETEISAQLTRFRRLVGRDPTHLDSHQHVHRDEPAAAVCSRLAAALGVPLRHFGPIRYCGDFYGQDRDGRPLPDNISVEGLVEIVAGLPSGATELACHPAQPADLDDMYGTAREDELRALCDPAVPAALEREGIRLGSFADVSAAYPIRGF